LQRYHSATLEERYTFFTMSMSTESSSRQMAAVARELADSTGFLLARLGIAFKGQAMDAAEQAGFEVHDYGVLAILAEGARATQSTIAEALGLDPSRLVALLDSLEQRGLIERRRDALDRRRHVVSITPAGERELVRLRGMVRGLETAYFAPLSGAECAALHELLTRLAVVHDPSCCPLADA
jgi:DNA-binding MarR family transcriptional regulator